MSKKNRNSYLKVGNNPFNIPVFEISADIDGVTRTDRLVLVDQKDDKEWELIISDGKIIIEPFDIGEKRDFRIDKIIK